MLDQQQEDYEGILGQVGGIGKLRHREQKSKSTSFALSTTGMYVTLLPSKTCGLTLWHLSKACRVSCSRLTTNSGDRNVSPWVSILGPSGRFVRCLILSFSSWILHGNTLSREYVTVE